MEPIWEGVADDIEESRSQTSDQVDAQLYLAMSKAAMGSSASAWAVCFSGLVQGNAVKILIDSGSSASFVSTALASKLVNVSLASSSSTVHVAGGGILQSCQMVQQMQWSIGDYTFCSDFWVLPLCSYDLIVGMDWLEQFSPMQIDWRCKWLLIPYQGEWILLQGLTSDRPEKLLLQVCHIEDSADDSSPIASSFTQFDSSLPLEIQSLLGRFQSVLEPPTELPPSRACNHTISLIPGAQPVFIRPYRYPPGLKDEIEKQVNEMLEQGIIHPSASPFSSPVLLVKKKDGSYRFCVDFRQLNAITAKSKFPVLVFDELMDELGSASWFSTLDLRAGFHQILLQPGEEPKTAFQTHCGQYEFRVMTFGLTGAPGSFQGAMNSTLAPGLRKFVVVFFDDILVYSRSFEEHLVHLELMFQWLAEDQWKVKLSKCKFAQREISYLGHVLTEHGLKTDPAKIQAISSWPVPSNVRSVRGFLGLAGYYRKFIRHFSLITKPLTDLLHKDSLFVWTSIHDEAFATLKAALSSAPVLGIPDFSKPFHIETDASGYGIGAVLIQDGHPLAFISKALGKPHLGLSAYEKEYLAILMAVDQWRHYLHHNEFVIHSDHRSLVHLNEQCLHTPWQQKVFTKLLSLRYRVVYRKGSENGILNRCMLFLQLFILGSNSLLLGILQIHLLSPCSRSCCWMGLLGRHSRSSKESFFIRSVFGWVPTPSYSSGFFRLCTSAQLGAIQVLR